MSHKEEKKLETEQINLTATSSSAWEEKAENESEKSIRNCLEVVDDVHTALVAAIGGIHVPVRFIGANQLQHSVATTYYALTEKIK